MFKKIKKYIIYGVLLLCLVLTPTLITLLYNGDSIDVYERTINVSEIGELSYEEKAKNFLSTLDDVNINKNETKLVIKAKYNKSNIDFTSTGEEPYDAICSSEFRLDSNKFVFTSGKVVDSVEVYDSIDEYDVSIDESTDDVFLTDENGNKINVKEMLDSESIENCSVIVASAALIWGIVAVATIFVGGVTLYYSSPTLADNFTTNINVLIEGIKDGFCSFWERIKLAFGAITAVSISKPLVLSEDNIEELEKKAKKRKDYYLLLNNFKRGEYLSTNYAFTNIENAKNWIKKGGSIWSPFSHSSSSAVVKAGYIPGGINKETKKYERYIAEIHNTELLAAFYHYHTLDRREQRVNQNVHAFFGLPLLKNNHY